MAGAFKIRDTINNLKFTVNSDILKFIAVVSMTADHLVKGINFEYTSLISNSVGRISFPIFGFLIALNLARYKNNHPDTNNIYKKYLIRLLIFGTATLYLDYLTTGIMKYNIMFTFSLSVLFVYIIDIVYSQNFSDIQKVVFILISVLWFVQISVLVEYGIQGVFYIVLFYCFLVYKKDYFLIGLLFFAFFLNSGIFVTFITLATVLFLLLIQKPYSNQRRLFKQWWFFYLYYPVHKTLINLIF